MRRRRRAGWGQCRRIRCCGSAIRCCGRRPRPCCPARGADERDEALAGRVEQAARNAVARAAAARAAVLARSAAELTPDPDGPDAWRRRIYWLERLDAAGEFDQVRRLGEKWVLGVPVSLRGRLAAVRANVETDAESAYGLLAEAFEDLAGRTRP